MVFAIHWETTHEWRTNQLFLLDSYGFSDQHCSQNRMHSRMLHSFKIVKGNRREAFYRMKNNWFVGQGKRIDTILLPQLQRTFRVDYHCIHCIWDCHNITPASSHLIFKRHTDTRKVKRIDTHTRISKVGVKCSLRYRIQFLCRHVRYDATKLWTVANCVATGKKPKYVPKYLYSKCHCRECTSCWN